MPLAQNPSILPSSSALAAVTPKLMPAPCAPGTGAIVTLSRCRSIPASWIGHFLRRPAPAPAPPAGPAAPQALACRPAPSQPAGAACSQAERGAARLSLALDGRRRWGRVGPSRDGMIFKLPTTTVKQGDVIVTSENPFSAVFVEEVGNDGQVQVLNPAISSSVRYVQPFNLFGQRFFVKATNLLESFGSGDSQRSEERRVGKECRCT